MDEGSPHYLWCLLSEISLFTLLYCLCSLLCESFRIQGLNRDQYKGIRAKVVNNAGIVYHIAPTSTPQLLNDYQSSNECLKKVFGVFYEALKLRTC